MGPRSSLDGDPPTHSPSAPLATTMTPTAARGPVAPASLGREDHPCYTGACGEGAHHTPAFADTDVVADGSKYVELIGGGDGARSVIVAAGVGQHPSKGASLNVVEGGMASTVEEKEIIRKR